MSSEQTHLNQMTLFNASETTADSTQERSKITEVKAHYRKRTRLTTDKLPEDLPVEIIEHELPEKDRTVRNGMVCTQWKKKPERRLSYSAKVVILRHVRHIYARTVKLRRIMCHSKSRHAGACNQGRVCFTGNHSPYSGTKIYDGIALIPSRTGMETIRHFVVKADYGKLAD